MTHRSLFLLQISALWVLASACEQTLNLGESDPVPDGNGAVSDFGGQSGAGAGSSGRSGSGGVSGSAGTASGGSAGAEAPSQCPFPVVNVPEVILWPTCGSSSCHDAVSPQADLDFNSPGLEARLVDQPSSGCPQLLLVDSAAPERSLLLDKLVNQLPSCGDPMPPLGTALPATQIACIREWIELIARD